MRENKYSQFGEEIIILDVFEKLGIEKGHLVDIGAGDGYTYSNARALLDKGWTGDLYDGDPKGAKDVKQVWVTKEWASWEGRIPPVCNFVNLDLDGNDYWILQELMSKALVPKPDLWVCEINPIFQRHEAKVMPYNEAHVWQEDTYYGMSLAACEKLAAQYGYTLMHLHVGINAFLLRNDHAKAHPELIRPIEYRPKRDHAPHNPELPWITV